VDLSSRAQQTLYRVRLAIQGGRDLSFLPAWIADFTANPKDPTRRWSFDRHEFQLEIAAALTYPEISVPKCSQVGLSELSVRMCLAYAAMRQPTQVIYTLQTAKFANTFCTTRFDPVIGNSTALSEILDPDTDNNSLKKLGGSFVHITGASLGMDPISVPASALFHDEVDFSDQDVLTTYQSRIGHEDEGEHHTSRFSTPTVKGYGIDKFYGQSSRGRYTVRCDRCGERTAPNFFDDVVVPGLEKPLVYLERTDLDDPKIRIQDAFLQCPACRRPLTLANLADPAKRLWVHACPDNPHRGFKVAPFDVPTINPVHRTLSQLGDYKYKHQWVNFKVGEVYEDAENSFLDTVVERNTVLSRVSWLEWGGRPTVIGIDVGKTSWIAVGTRNGPYIDVVYLGTLEARDLHDTALGEQILPIKEGFCAALTIIDAAPDFTTAQTVVKNSPEKTAYGCYYERQGSGQKAVLKGIRTDDSKGIVMADRTAAFDDLAGDINKGRIRFCRCPEMGQVRKHLSGMKRISEVVADGQTLGRWVDTGPTHFAHALNYMRMGFTLLDDDLFFPGNVITLPPLSKIRLPSSDTPVGLVNPVETWSHYGR
jgi:hypothetical protein